MFNNSFLLEIDIGCIIRLVVAYFMILFLLPHVSD
jgi:hypothetical protein